MVGIEACSPQETDNKQQQYPSGVQTAKNANAHALRVSQTTLLVLLPLEMCSTRCSQYVVHRAQRKYSDRTVTLQ